LGAGIGTRASLSLAASRQSGNPGVAVVGGGLAGLRAAHALLEIDHTIDVRIYEGNDCLGGRCYTNHGFFDDNMHAELGGHLINLDQRDI
jgi:monoamine oxidase